MHQKQISLVRSMIEKEVSESWARLYKVPSTFTWKCLDHLSSLKPSSQEKVFAEISLRAPIMLGSVNPPTKWDESILKHFYEGVLQSPSEHISSRLLRGMLASKQVDGAESMFANLSDEMVEKAKSINPTKASEIRKVVKREFADHFGSNPVNFGGGTWKYEGESSSRRISVLIDYGGLGDQLRYWVEFQDQTNMLHPRMLTYEGLLGMGHGRWDYVTVDNLVASIQLLREMIEELATIPDRLKSFGSI